MIFSGKGELISALRVTNVSSLEQEAGGTRVVDIDRQGGSDTTSNVQSGTAKKKPSKPTLRDKVITGTVLKGADIGPVMLMIAGGEFTMGSDRNQISPDERPAHEVTLQNFAISRYEVTFVEYDRFAEATGRPLPDDNGWGRGKRPVINVNWADASAYARWLSARTGKRYRLPTEAEWEYAAAGGSDSVYWWGYEFETGRANCFDCGSGWDQKSTAPVGRFGPNGFGLHDTAGNVREWVRDCYHGSYTGAPLDGSAWEESGCKERVVRGGAYDKPAESMRSTWRGALKADTRLPMIGFRVVQEL
jgi:formylglycine-generating enzyme required for sulfatase activity